MKSAAGEPVPISRIATRELDEAASSPKLDPTLQVEFISDATRLEGLEADWRGLWSALPDTTPFQSPDWILPWWHHYSEGPLFTFAFWSGPHLVGLAPLYIYTGADHCRRVFLIGTGNTDYLDVLFDRGRRNEARTALLGEIQSRADFWDECDFQRLRASSTLLPSAGNLPGLITLRTEQQPCPALDLSSPSAKPMLETARAYARKLQSDSSFKIEIASEVSLGHFYSELMRLHQCRWEERGLPGVLADSRDRSFHREVAHRFLRSGLLRLYALQLEGVVRAVLYGFRHDDRMYFYLSGFDPEYSRMSVGTVLLAHAIETAAAEGCRFFDFLKGQEPYKYRWGASDEAVYARTIRKAP